MVSFLPRNSTTLKDISAAVWNGYAKFVGTGTELAAITAANGGQAGMLAMALDSTSNFTANQWYVRKAANDGWYSTGLSVSATKVTGTT